MPYHFDPFGKGIVFEQLAGDNVATGDFILVLDVSDKGQGPNGSLKLVAKSELVDALDLENATAAGLAMLNAADAAAQKVLLSLGNVTNTADASKPVSTAQQTALDLKANIASPTFTGTVGGVTKAMVGLTNADDTSDANKPISTATQTALDLKVDEGAAVTTANTAHSEPADFAAVKTALDALGNIINSIRTAIGAV